MCPSNRLLAGADRLLPSDPAYLKWGLLELESAVSLAEIKSLRDYAESTRILCRSLGVEVENRAAELRVRAERKLGQLLAESELRGGDRRSAAARTRPRLSDYCLSNQQSYLCQLIASVPSADFENYIRTCKRNRERITSDGILKLARRAPLTEVQEAPPK